MKRLKLVYIVSDIDKSLHFEWVARRLKLKFELSFILIGKPQSDLEEFLEGNGIRVFTIPFAKKRSDLLSIWLRVFRLLRNLKPDIVHTHLWIANLAGLSAARAAGVKKRIYTRHHGTIHYDEHPSGLKWDRLNNRLATRIIAASRNVQHILIKLDRADDRKVRLIPHGFDFSYFENVSPGRVDGLRQKYGIGSAVRPVVGVISRLTQWKGVQYIIPAFDELRKYFPDSHLILANAHGDFEREIDALLKRLPASSFTKVTFEEDVAALYRMFDIFVHAPVDERCEAFGQTYIESLIAKVPSVFTLSGIATEFIKNRQNALVVPYRDPDALFGAMREICSDNALREDLAKAGKDSVAGFTIERYLDSLESLYFE